MTFNSWTFVFELVNFLVLAYILQRLLYRPLHDAIDRRRQGIEQAQAEAQQARQEAEQQRLALGVKLSAIDDERRRVLEGTHQEAEAERARILAAATSEIQHRETLARDLLERQKVEARESLQQDLVHEATRLAERLLREVSDAELDTRLVCRLVDTVRSLPAEQREGLAQGWTTGERATLETAHDLTTDEVEQVHDAVAGLLGQDFVLLVQRNPELLSGVRLRLDGHVWDASLLGGLEETDDGHTPAGTR